MEMNRRDVSLSGVAMTAVTLAGQGSAEAAPAATPRTKFDPNAWHQRIKRIMQVNFDERDAEALDIEKYADYLASIKAQATYLSITNQTAFYPTKIPDLITSRWLNGRDFFGECVKALRARNIRIVGRLSIDLAPTAMIEKHPDWFLRNKDGSIPDRGGLPGYSPRFRSTCQFTSYYSDFIPKVIEEVVSRYDIDAVYSNGWPGTRVVACEGKVCDDGVSAKCVPGAVFTPPSGGDWIERGNRRRHRGRLRGDRNDFTCLQGPIGPQCDTGGAPRVPDLGAGPDR